MCICSVTPPKSLCYILLLTHVTDEEAKAFAAELLSQGHRAGK